MKSLPSECEKVLYGIMIRKTNIAFGVDVFEFPKKTEPAYE